jgi:ribosome-binding factor A
MSGYRPERVAEMIHRELAQRLRLEIKDPELTPISITSVRVTRDLSRATIEYLPLGGSEAAPSLAGALERAGRHLRGPIGRALRLRTAPEIVFIRDRHTEQAIAVTSLLAKLSHERDGGDDEE